MTLGEAYRVLELEPGASEEAVRDARKTLAKVWHPDRHASDPELQAKAERRLAAINVAFEALREASSSLGFGGRGGMTTYHDINNELRIAPGAEP